MKAKLANIQVLLLCLVGCYPLLKFNLSSIIFIVFSVITFFWSVMYSSILFSKKNAKQFFYLSAFLLSLLFSVFYSKDTTQALEKNIQLLPILLALFFVVFCEFELSNKTKNIALKTFLFINICYTLVVLVIFFLNYKTLNLELSYFALSYDMFQLVVEKSVRGDMLFVHKPYFSMGFVICAIFCLNEFFKGFKKIKKRQWSYLIAFLYFVIWVFYAFSFPNVIGLCLSILIVLFFNLKRKTFLTTACIILSVGVFLVSVKLNDVDVQRGFNFIKSLANEKRYDVNDVRKEIYLSHVEILKSANLSTFFFGFGIGDVQAVLNKNYEERYLEKKIKNLLFFNEEFNDPYWHKKNVVVSDNRMVSPFGEKNTDVLSQNPTKDLASYSISKNMTLSQYGLYTLSIFAKRGVNQFLIVRLGHMHQRAVFNLENGSVMQKMKINTASIQVVNNDWYRCSITVDLKTDPLVLFGLTDQSASYHISSNNFSVPLWGAQLEYGNLTNYKRNGAELLHTAKEKKFNSHNYYLHILLVSGVLGLGLFVLFLFQIVKISVLEKNVFGIVFCTVLILNFLTENIFSRHWGIIYFAFIFLVVFSKVKEKHIESV